MTQDDESKTQHGRVLLTIISERNEEIRKLVYRHLLRLVSMVVVEQKDSSLFQRGPKGFAAKAEAATQAPGRY